MRLRTILYLFFIILFFAACSTRTNFSQKTKSQQYPRWLIYDTGFSVKEQFLKLDTLNSWQITPTTNISYLVEDSLKNFHRLLITFSSLAQLDHRQTITLKRYMEAGGEVIAAQDSLNDNRAAAWLRNFEDYLLDQKIIPERGKLLIIRKDKIAADNLGKLVYTEKNKKLPDYRKATTIPVPDSSRFTYQVLSQGMDEPMQMALLPGNQVLFIERKGAIKLYDPVTNQTKLLANLEVFSGIEDGLLGVAADPNFNQNHWIYLYYAVPGDKAVNRLARMELQNVELNRASEKVLLEIPTQRKYCCHSAGYLQFGPGGLLYLATGDNTNAEETEGYIPIDERPGRQLADDQATAANTNDLRGKILRLKPEPDGTYSIPKGNLFPEGTSQTRPEIYTMGHRNPYRFSVDPKNNFVYWGDIGPDTKVPASEGTLSFDEVNQARQPGFFGWPYFLGNNEAFPYYDYATKKFRSTVFNPARPLNQSPNNTGLRELPTAQPAFIWYGDGASQKFPLVGKGGQSVLAGPVYYADLFPEAKYKLPAYYNGKLFIYDWVRRWIMAVTFDENKNYVRMEPFLDHIPFSAPTDMQFAPDGAIYILEYGTNWFAKNNDARLIRVEYAEGNRKPIAHIKVNQVNGSVPLPVTLSAAGSKDFDRNDSLEYSWEIEGKRLKGKQITYTFQKAGTYGVALKVADNHGESGTAVVQIKAGNAPPVVTINANANRSFYWDNSVFDYQVQVADPEDKVIDPGKVKITWNFMPQGKDVAVALTSSTAAGNLQHIKGQYLINSLDCKACHSLDQVSVGPAYNAVAARYAGQPDVTAKLVQKIMKGGSGNWGKRSMSAHPDLAPADAKEMVAYILSLNEKFKNLPLKGNLPLQQHLGQGNEGSYLLTAQYTDQGANSIEPITTRDYVVLRNPLLQVEDYDGGNIKLGTVTTEFLTYATAITPQSFVKFNQLDLKQVKSLVFRVQPVGAGGQIQVHLDEPNGPIACTAQVPAKISTAPKWQEIKVPVQPTAPGKHDLYIRFVYPENAQSNLFNLDWIYFADK